MKNINSINPMKQFSRILFLLAITIMAGRPVMAQECETPFRANLYNKEIGVYLTINLHEKNISVPDHELYGMLPGYLGKDGSSFYWMIVDAEIHDGYANLQLINDYGSEDLEAKLTLLNDSTYKLVQEKGSALKVINKGKWLKLPKALIFVKR